MVSAAEARRARALLPAAGRGAAAGLVGVAVMMAAGKLEQAVTRRPNSYVPARTLLALLGRHPSDADRPTGWIWAMHYGMPRTSRPPRS
jgi:hypothetical protein